MTRFMKTYRPLRNLLNFIEHEFFQLGGILVVGSSFIVVGSAIIEDELRVSDELFNRAVGIRFESSFHCFEIWTRKRKCQYRSTCNFEDKKFRDNGIPMGSLITS